MLVTIVAFIVKGPLNFSGELFFHFPFVISHFSFGHLGPLVRVRSCNFMDRPSSLRTSDPRSNTNHTK